MKAPIQHLATLCLLLGLGAAPAEAAGQEPGSVLIYPVFETGGPYETILSVTNANEDPSQLGVTVRIELVGAVDKSGSTTCSLSNRYYDLAPADTLSLAVGCVFPGSGAREGYVVVTALKQGTPSPVSHDDLMGSVLVYSQKGSVYSVPAVSFTSPLEPGKGTDVDGDGRLDFDGREYEPAPDRLYVDSYVAGIGTRLGLLSLPSGQDTYIEIRAYNDDSRPFSATYTFHCWMNERLEDISLIFDPLFLANNVQNDPDELDLDCDGRGDVETGWFRVEGLVAYDGGKPIPDPVLLGVLTQTKGDHGMARSLWRRGERMTGEL